MGFTKAQQAVIDARNSNVLVSAAAGSGKTTVLVERIIQKITEDQGIDIDRLLVVTFTKAAAAQMKEKILNAIQKRLIDEPDNAHLQRQETLVHGAQITTIDSFCQYVIRNNFNEIDLDPSYRVGDEGEMKLLQSDVVEELLEEKYEEGSEDFLDCTEYFSTGNNDKKLETFILKLYGYAMSMPFPEEWLEERKKDYLVSDENFEELFFVKECKKHAREVISECLERINAALSLANEPDGPYQYGDLLEKEAEMIGKISLEDGITYDELRGELLNISFSKLPVKSDPSINIDKREAAKTHRAYVKDQISKLTGSYFSEDSQTVIKHMALAAGPVETLSQLAISFKERFDAKKREKGIIDFGDMEHLALNILVKRNEDGSIEPTGAAMQYRDHYDEVMIDEYQDSNSVQELLLSAVSGEKTGRFNRFMVGDVKQSIYKFRLARPEIFMEKMGSYSSDESANARKITLHNNFRSRREVLDGVNYIFEQIMGEDLGGVMYDDDAALVTSATYPEAQGSEYATELMMVNKAGLNSGDGRSLEASMTAQRIDELMKTMLVTGNDGKLRSLKYSDIVILLRASTGWDDAYKKALESRGIPAYIESKTGYFSATEVVTVLNILNVLNNPLQDIPLVSVLHSPMGGFSDEDLAIIKAADKRRKKGILDGRNFYEILERSIAESENDQDDDSVNENVKTEKNSADSILSQELINKIRDFIELIGALRDKSEYLPIDELIKDILDTTKYYEYCAALPGGEKRIANLNMLIEKASDYERTSFKGLFHFVRYIEQLSKYEVDFGEAGVLDEHADIVRIMSIHKSKGLEFPVVFIGGMSKQFNYIDMNQAVVCDMDLGIGTHAIDLVNRIKYKTLRKSVMDDLMKMDVLGEEMRILYVAMTRAKEKLIMTGQAVLGEGEKIAAEDIRSKLSNLMRFREREPISGIQPYLLPYFQRSSAKSYLELILMALVRHPDLSSLAEQIGIDCSTVPEENSIPVTSPENMKIPVSFGLRILSEDDITGAEIVSDTTGNLRLKNLVVPVSGDGREMIDLFEERFAEEYRYSSYKGLFVKTSVSELKKAKIDEEMEPSAPFYDEEKDIPGFMEEKKKGLSGAERGTLYHKVMELLFDGTYDEYLKRIADISVFMEEAIKDGKLGENAVDTISISDIQKFIDTDLAKRMADAMKYGHLHREAPFMMGVPADRLDKTLPGEELVLVQGIIDVWFEENDNIILLDYKTDKVKTGEELVKKYSIQLDYYQEALTKITEKKVKERLIYSFTLGKTIRV